MSKILQVIFLSFCLVAGSVKLTFAQLSANFSATPTSGCKPLSFVQFTDLSTGGIIISWNWDFGNGNNSNVQNPAASYPNAGTYTVTLIISNGTQWDTIVKPNYITVFENPVAHFTFLPPSPCVNSTVTFTDNSILGDGPIVSWNWDYGDGNTQVTLTGNATHSYGVTGTFPVSVIITDANGCSSNFDTSLTVIAKPVSAFSGSPLSSCTAPLTVNFTNSSVTSGPATYLWRFGDGITSTLQNPSHNYSVQGVYTITLVVSQGSNCEDSIVKPNYVNLTGLVANFTANDTDICIGTSVQFTNTSVPSMVTWLWDFGDGSTSTVLNPSHTYSTAGPFTVTLSGTDATGCTDIIVKTNYITVRPLPVALYGPLYLTVCSFPYTVNFLDSTVGAISWQWNFGDGFTSTLQNPSHTYTSPGFYTVTHSALNIYGCYDNITGYVYIYPPEVYINFAPKWGCAPLTVSFGCNVNSFEPITSYTWNFGPGEGQVVTAINSTSHTYNTPGVFPVWLAIESQSGCKDTITDTVKVGFHVTPNFTVVDDSVCYNQLTQFNSNITGANTYIWIYGDGVIDSSETASDPGHIYGEPGTYTVTLIACNNGCCDTLVKPNFVTILPPKANFAFAPYDCNNPYTVTLANSAIDSDSTVWNFGDGTIITSGASTISHTFITKGLHTITQYTWNFTWGCQDSISFSINITDPISRFQGTPLDGCYALTVTFTDTSQDAVSYYWDFGDGFDTLLAAPVYVHTYQDTGYYTVTHVIYDAHGCTDTLIKNQYVHVYGPYAAFSANDTAGCRPHTVTFTSTTASEYPITTYIWNFGDGVQDTVATPGISHTYTSNGTFTVSMTVTDSQGCTDVLIKSFYVDVTYPYPAAVVDTFACPNEVLLFNASASSVAQPANFHWVFGDGNVLDTNIFTATHAYLTNGIYSGSLTITDRNGCDSTITFTIRIETPVAGFYTTQTPSCGFNAVVFTDTSTGTAITGSHWFFGDGGSSVVFGSVSHNYTNPGSYSVTLVSINSAGCTDTVTIDSLVVVPGPIGTFTFSPQKGCIPLTVNFTATSPNSVNYTWDFGDGTVLTTTSTTISHTYTTTTAALPQLTLTTYLTNGDTCQIDAPSPDSVIAYTLDANLNLTQNVICSGSAGSIDIVVANGTPPYIFSWSNNATTEDITGLSAGIYTVTITDSIGCTLVTSGTITHPTNIPGDLFIEVDGDSSVTDIELSEGQQVSLTLQTNIGGNPSYQWTPSTGLSCDTCPNPVLTATGQSLMYFVVITDTNGCYGTDSVNVKFVSCEDAMHVPNVFTPNGDGYNDELYVEHPCPENFIIVIYNRWGQEVFKTSNPVEKWDGRTSNSEFVPAGTYYWILVSRGKSQKGFVHLLRDRE